MVIRKATRKDMPRLTELLNQVLMVHHRGRPDLFHGNTRKYTDEELQQLLQDEQRPIFVAVNEADLVCGYAFCVFQQELHSHILTDIKTLYLDDLCVDEAMRGQGIGTQLYQYVLSYARVCGCYHVTLNVWNCNESAMRFYEACGLKPYKVGMECILEENRHSHKKQEKRDL